MVAVRYRWFAIWSTGAESDIISDMRWIESFRSIEFEL